MFYVIILSVPYLLCAKPIYLVRQKKRQIKFTHLSFDETMNLDHTGPQNRIKQLPAINDAPENVQGSDSSVLNMLIMHFVESFEFVLSIISNTASYLRLWALSLAHSVLSEILWEMVLRNAFKTGPSRFFNVLRMVIIVTLWQLVSVGFLIVMEGMSAALHGVRLHWVEFFNKFFHGEGTKFCPMKYAIENN